jgi:hypothetical protein
MTRSFTSGATGRITQRRFDVFSKGGFSRPEAAEKEGEVGATTPEDRTIRVSEAHTRMADSRGE